MSGPVPGSVEKCVLLGIDFDVLLPTFSKLESVCPCSSNASALLLVAPKTHPLTSLVPEKYSNFSSYSLFFCITNPPLLFCTAAHSLPHCLLSHPVVLLTSLILPFWQLDYIFLISLGIQSSSKLCISSSYLLQLCSPLSLPKKLLLSY